MVDGDCESCVDGDFSVTAAAASQSPHYASPLDRVARAMHGSIHPSTSSSNSAPGSAGQSGSAGDAKMVLVESGGVL